MELIKMKVDYKTIKIHISKRAYNDFDYMEDIKALKNQVRYAVKENRQNKGKLGITSWHFVASAINNPSYRLVRLTDNEFIVERIGAEENV